MSTEFRKLLDERKLLRTAPKRNMILKEIEAAESDIDDARASLEQTNFKWATIQGYYSMFHSARALLYSKGFREKSHYALLVSLRELFINVLGNSMIRSFEDAMGLRQQADYGLKFSEAGALDTVDAAEKLLRKSREILNIRN